MTEEFHPGFRNSTAAYTVSLLQPKIIHDLKLYWHGLRIVERRAQNFLPLPDGRYLLTGEGRTVREIAKFSEKDAERYPAYQAKLGPSPRCCAASCSSRRPTWHSQVSPDAMGELGKLAAIGKSSGSPRATRRPSIFFANRPAKSSTARSDSHPIKAVLGFDAVVGNLASPYTPGSAYVLLHHMLGEVNGKKGVWGHAIGGMGAITQAMAKAAGVYGARIDTDSAVREVIIERDRATGVVLADGTRSARAPSSPTWLRNICF